MSVHIKFIHENVNMVLVVDIAVVYIELGIWFFL